METIKHWMYGYLFQFRTIEEGQFLVAHIGLDQKLYEALVQEGNFYRLSVIHKEIPYVVVMYGSTLSKHFQKILLIYATESGGSTTTDPEILKNLGSFAKLN